MLDIEVTRGGVFVRCGDWISWIDKKLQDSNEVRLSKVFTVLSDDLAMPDNEDVRVFRIGSLDGEYYRIPARILGLDSDVCIHKSMRMTKEVFVAKRQISVMKSLSDHIRTPIVIGGEKRDAIPISEFMAIVRQFPTNHEMWLYAKSRIEHILSEYADEPSRFEKRLSKYVENRDRRRLSDTKSSVDRSGVRELEFEKFTYLRDKLKAMLDAVGGYSETEWQREIVSIVCLIFPKYFTVIREMKIKDSYSEKFRKVDFALIDAGGNVDILEIKKPTAGDIFRRGRNRDNHVATRELTAAIFQAEKYIFHISKWGTRGEDWLQKKYGDILPDGLSFRVANPGALILMGRDVGEGAALDYEILRRQYSRILDVLTYDDLLRRLDVILLALDSSAESDQHESHQ